MKFDIKGAIILQYVTKTSHVSSNFDIAPIYTSPIYGYNGQKINTFVVIFKVLEGITEIIHIDSNLDIAFFFMNIFI